MLKRKEYFTADFRLGLSMKKILDWKPNSNDAAFNLGSERAIKALIHTDRPRDIWARMRCSSMTCQPYQTGGAP